MPHPFFDAFEYPWSRPDAQAAHQVLFKAVGNPSLYTLLYQQSGSNLHPLTPHQPANVAWKEILEQLTAARRLNSLCDRVLADANLATAHEAISAIRDAPDLLDDPLLSDDSVFVNRKRLRGELAPLYELTPRKAVLLVRGPSGCGKSWTRYYVYDRATQLGALCTYFGDGLVSNVEDVIGQLFDRLGAPGAVPAKLETDAQWFGKVCRRLQAIAEEKRKVCWVVADDLGNTKDNAPLMDVMIRQFFEQFALFVLDPGFARWFRLVLLDYPDGGLPSKWKDFWVEDRPDEKEVDEEPISQFLLARAARMKKRIDEEKARQIASEVLAKANAPQPPGKPPKPRLKVIHDELTSVVQKL
jgi:hypothetical protein